MLEQAWEDATSGAAERDKSWKTAEQLLCALNRDATCATTPTPTVKAVELANGVADAVCPVEEPADSKNGPLTKAEVDAYDSTEKLSVNTKCIKARGPENNGIPINQIGGYVRTCNVYANSLKECMEKCQKQGVEHNGKTVYGRYFSWGGPPGSGLLARNCIGCLTEPKLNCKNGGGRGENECQYFNGFTTYKMVKE